MFPPPQGFWRLGGQTMAKKYTRATIRTLVEQHDGLEVEFHAGAAEFFLSARIKGNVFRGRTLATVHGLRAAYDWIWAFSEGIDFAASREYDPSSELPSVGPLTAPAASL